VRVGLLLTVTVAASVVMGFRAAVSYAQPGVDASYAFALNYAAVRGEVWGEQFLADRGPYGWLVEPVDVGDVAWSWLRAQALLVVLVGAVAAAYVSSAPHSGASSLLLALVLVYTVHIALGEEWRWFSLFLLLFLLGLHRDDRAGFVAFGLAGALGGFLLLVKLTIGPGALAALGAGSLLRRRAGAVVTHLFVAGGCATLGVILGWVGHYGSTSGLARYLSVGWSSVTGYSSGGSISFDGWQVTVGAFLAFFLLLAAWALVVRDRRARLSVAGCAVPLLLAWKYSVVRQDVHGRVLVLFGFMVVAVLVIDSLTAERRWRAAPFLAGAVMSLTVAWFYLPFSVDESTRAFATALGQPLRLSGLRGIEALARLPQYRGQLAQASRTALEPLVLPVADRALLANSTVDVYPWEAAYVAANHLKWAHRPSPGSSSSFNTTLDRLNAAYFDSPRRPERLLWHRTPFYLLHMPDVTGVASIDGRHVFWDEPFTLVSILDHYRLVGAGSVFVLAPRAAPRFVGRRPIGTVTVPWGVWAPVPDSPGVVLAEIHIQRPLWARLRRVLLREEEMSMDVRYRGRRLIHARFFPDSAASGFWISPLPHSAANLESLLAGDLPEGARVAAIRFWNGWGRAVAPDLRISWIALEERTPSSPPQAAIAQDMPEDRGAETTPK
jgi:hypothetical protein